MLSKTHKVHIGLGICIIWGILNIAAFLTRNSALSLLCFWSAGVLSLIILYHFLGVSSRMAEIRFTKKDVIRLIIALALGFFIYLILIMVKHSIYTWDSVGYYKMMESLLQQFQIHNITGFSEWFFSGLTYDYGDFLQIFVYPFYAFSNHSIEAYIISYYLGVVIPVIISLYIAGLAIIKKVTSEELLYQRGYIKTVLCIALVLFPLLHGAAINGQPDITGLVFVGIIISITVDYDFSRREPKRWSLVLLVTIALVLTRRWYMFFVVAYYFSYAIITLLDLLIKRKFNEFKKSLSNILIFGVSSIVIAVIVLFKMVVRILGNQYSESYAAWNRGGLSYEPLNQLQFLGVFVGIIVGIGLIFGLLNTRARKSSCIMLAAYAVEMFLFTRIQNAGYHQSLIFFPFYLYCIVLFLVFTSNKNQPTGLISSATVTIVLLCSFVNCSCFAYENKPALW